MSRFLSGALIVLFVIVVSLVAGTVSALFSDDVAPQGQTYSRCTSSNNATTCEDLGKGSFLSQVFGATFSPFDGEGDLVGFLNAIWVLVLGFLLAVGVILMAVSFIPLTSS